MVMELVTIETSKTRKHYTGIRILFAYNKDTQVP